ncbi:MAG: c-type cytochrome, partial [Spirochaetia bacterium]|nr:c-type cytochrome [Spirochaetia bacterium]
MNKITRVSALFLALFVAVAVANNCKKKAAEDATTTQTASAMSDEDSAKAKKLFTERCSTCHGPMGKGDGPAGAALNPKPRNFSKIADYK